MTRVELQPADLSGDERVLAFFRRRMRLPPVLIDGAQREEGLALRDEVRLSSDIAGTPRQTAVVAHELFHAWSRAAVAPVVWGGLPRLVPSFLSERAPERASFAAANVEEILTDRLAEGLCRDVGAAFEPAYLSPTLPQQYVRLVASRALEAVAAAVAEPSAQALLAARSALRRVSGFELAALGLHHRVAWPAALALVGEALGPAEAALSKLDAPRALAATAAAFANPAYASYRRSPLWEGASPLELPGVTLEQKLSRGDAAALDDASRFLFRVSAALRRVADGR
jgi:hypothetical protein